MVNGGTVDAAYVAESSFRNFTISLLALHILLFQLAHGVVNGAGR